LCDRTLELQWIRRAPKGRAVFVTPDGVDGLGETFGVDFSHN
jgi:hypothetical protein